VRIQKIWVLRGVFQQKRKKIRGGRRKLQNEKLHDFYRMKIVK
jgi:hypothetical protein